MGIRPWVFGNRAQKSQSRWVEADQLGEDNMAHLIGDSRTAPLS